MITAGQVIRTMFGLATVVFLAVGFLVEEPRFYAAAGLLGAIWGAWNRVVNWVFGPIGDLSFRLLQGEANLPSPNSQPVADETIRVLELRLERTVSRESDIQAALRLADLYRVIRKDPLRADAIIGMMRKRYPEAPELGKSSRSFPKVEPRDG